MSEDLPEDYDQYSRGDEEIHDDALNPRMGRAADDPGEDEDEEEEEEEDDDDGDEDEDDEEDGPSRKRQKRSKKAANKYLDVEAEVDNDDEDLDEDDDDLKDTRDFIEADDPSLETSDGRRRIMADHHRLDRQQEAIVDQDAEAMARRLKERYARPTARYIGDEDHVPQRLLMPSVKDAFLWQIRVKPGREKDIVFSLMRKYLEKEYPPQHSLEIYSAFYRDSLPGMIYVEARNEKQVHHAVSGLVGVYPSRGFVLVPIDEMASLLKIKKQQTTITPGSWIRIKRGKYAGDLAQVLDVTDNGEDAGLKFIPRIDLTPKENDSLKRKKGALSSSIALSRPPQRLFNIEEVTKVYGQRSCVRRNNGEYVFNGDTYRNGFLEKDIKIHGILTENVNPTLDEITAFQAANEDTEDGGPLNTMLDLSIIADAAKKAATAVLQPGDHVEVFEGEQVGVDGIVESIRDDIVVLRAKVMDHGDQRIEVPAASVRKRFKPGDHVKVMAGKNADETGLVVAVNGDVVSIWSDVSSQEVTVFSKDVREAAEVGSGTNAVGQYELHDLVQLDQQTVGVIFKTERVSFRVLDQNGAVRHVQPHQITMRRDSSRAVATDAEGHPIRVQDTLKEVEGERRRGTVLHIHQSQYAFLHNRELTEHGGVFVARCRALASLAPKGGPSGRAGVDLSSMNPAVTGGAVGGIVGSGLMGRGPRDRLANTPVMVVKGEFKGYMGTIKDTNGNMARVELLTNNKVISIDKSKLKQKMPNTNTWEPLDSAFNGRPFQRDYLMPPPSAFPQRGDYANGNANPYMSSNGGRTPGQGITGRTPNPHASGRTPGWNQAVTPNPYAAGSRTPGWAAAVTPNPYANQGGRTPGWGGAVTPNPYAKSPPRTSAAGDNPWGDPSPTWNGGTQTTSGFGGSTPAREVDPPSPAAGDVWGDDSVEWAQTPSAPTPYTSAPTPFSAPTPGAGLGGATPYPDSAPTPAANASQTPRGHYPSTPGGAMTPYLGEGERSFGSSGKTLILLGKDWLVACHRIAQSNGKKFGFHATFDSFGAWRNGQFDGKTAVVTNVIEIPVPNSIISSTATASFEGAQEDLSGVPVEYFKPVHPVMGKANMVPCFETSGKFMGNLVRITDSDRDTGEFTVDFYDEIERAKNSLFATYRPNELVFAEVV